MAWFIAGLLLAGTALAAPPAFPEPDPDPERPRIGLVLSGGGARGGAHLGVLKVLEELRVPVDVIVGTSAGAIIGAAYASGMPLAEIEAEMRPLHTALLFRDLARGDLSMRNKADEVHNYIGPEIGLTPQGLGLPKGAVAGVSLEGVLRRLTVRQRQPDFDRLPIPFRAVATDLTSAEMVVLRRGSLATAVRASMALPAVVNPVEIDGRILVDGGVTRNLPVDVARAMGAQRLIVVNIGTPLHPREELTSLLTVSDQMVRILTARNVSQSLSEIGPNDVLITPDLGTVRTADFDRLFEAAKAGEVAARAAAPTLQALQIDPAAYAALAHRRGTQVLPAVTVDEVQVTGTQRVNPGSVRAAMRTRAGHVFDAGVADADMRRLYASGDFEHVGYFLSERPGGGHRLTTDVTEKSWGPHYLRFGLGLSSDFDGNAYFDLLLSHRRAWLNHLGAEWRTDLQIGHTDRLRTEWHQPLNVSQGLFASAHAEASREPFDLFVAGERFARYRRGQNMLGVDLGLAAGTNSELRVGVVRGRVRLSTDTGFIPGDALLPTTNVAGFATRLSVDTLDSLRFPRRGAKVDLRYFRSQPGLGAAERYGKLQSSLQAATSYGAHTLRAAALDSRGVGGGELPDHELAQLGGFLRLSGYRTGEFLGSGARMARLIYAYRVTAPGLLDGMHLGVSAEAGRITGALNSVDSPGTLFSNAAFLAVDTLLGPVYLGYGHAGRGQSAVYLYLGMP